MKLKEGHQYVLSLPEANEEPHFHYSSFRIRGKKGAEDTTEKLQRDIVMDFDADDLGFAYMISKNGELEIRHQGKYATRFSGVKAAKVAEQLEQMTFAGQQQLMARLTENYKHGNERMSKNHLRNKH